MLLQNGKDRPRDLTRETALKSGFPAGSTTNLTPAQRHRKTRPFRASASFT